MALAHDGLDHLVELARSRAGPRCRCAAPSPRARAAAPSSSTAPIICCSSASIVPCSPPRSTRIISSSAVTRSCCWSEMPNSRAMAWVSVVSSQTSGARTRPSKSIGTAKRKRQALGVGVGDGLGHQLAEEDREQADQPWSRASSEISSACGARTGIVGQRLAQVADDARAGEGRGEEADEGQADLDDGQEATGLAISRSTRRAPALPSSTSCSMRVRRTRTSENSAATKRPLRKISTAMMSEFHRLDRILLARRAAR